MKLSLWALWLFNWKKRCEWPQTHWAHHPHPHTTQVNPGFEMGRSPPVSLSWFVIHVPTNRTCPAYVVRPMSAASSVRLFFRRGSVCCFSTVRASAHWRTWIDMPQTTKVGNISQPVLKKQKGKNSPRMIRWIRICLDKTVQIFSSKFLVQLWIVEI